jgi:hypothetical protein
MHRFVASFMFIVVSSTLCQAETINIRCETTTNGGQPDPATITIDTENKTVVFQGGRRTQTFRDGFNGSIGGGYPGFQPASGLQFVTLTSAEYSWGVAGKYTATINRATGFLTANGNRYPCALAKGF